MPRIPGRVLALDPCVGDGVAFTCLLKDGNALRYGIEVDAKRAEQAGSLAIETLQANTMDVRCPMESVLPAYLNPPNDLEVDHADHQRREGSFWNIFTAG